MADKEKKVLKKKIIACRELRVLPAKRSIESLSAQELDGKRVLVRVDFNVPLVRGQISDDTRIRAALLTINYLLENGAKVVLVSHLGRPNGKVNTKFSLKPVAKRLGELLGQKVPKLEGRISVEVKAQIEKMPEARIVSLENIRFDPREESTDSDRAELARELAALADFYVNDAFGAAHRAHASTEGVARLLKKTTYAGFLMRSEMDILNKALVRLTQREEELKNLVLLEGEKAQPGHSVVAMVAGAKVSSKIGVLKALLGKVDILIIAGMMSLTFSAAKEAGKGGILDDITEKDLDAAREFLGKKTITKVVFPVDNVVFTDVERSGKTPAERFKPGLAEKLSKIVSSSEIGKEEEGVDIGRDTIRLFTSIINEANTVIWNGPVGVFEDTRFAKGTKAIAKAVAESEALVIVGGGDSLSAIEQAEVSDLFTPERTKFLSTGGGAMLEYIENNGKLPGIDVIPDQD